MVEPRYFAEHESHRYLPDTERQLEGDEAALQLLVLLAAPVHLAHVSGDELVAAVDVRHDEGDPRPEAGVRRLVDERVPDKLQETEDLVAVALETVAHHVVHLAVLQRTVVRKARPVGRQLALPASRHLGFPVQAEVLFLAELRILVSAPLLAHAPDIVEHEQRYLGVLLFSFKLVVDGGHLQQLHEVVKDLEVGHLEEAVQSLVRPDGKYHFRGTVRRKTGDRRHLVLSPTPHASDDLGRDHTFVGQVEARGHPAG